MVVQIMMNIERLVMKHTFSIVVPVYNRPDEVDELLQSLCMQELPTGYSLDDLADVVIVEDGSATPCRHICDKYKKQLRIHYYEKENGGPGPARNYGVERASGEYVLILDSDVVLPPTYLASVMEELDESEQQNGKTCDAFGGPDAAHPDFTPVQKAINYAMTSFFTTGGIRGGKAGKKGGAKLDHFFPRSYNMGIRREVYNSLGGFARMRFGEDVDFSYRIIEAGHTSRLFPKAWVWHKRRTNFRQFFKQVHNSGIARINLTKRHPGTLKLVHMLPTVFTLGVLACLWLFLTGLCLWYVCEVIVSAQTTESLGMLGSRLQALGLGPILLYALLIFADSAFANHSCRVGLLSVPAAFIQLIGYGTGFIRSWWQRCILGRDEFEAFKTNFYK